MKDLKLFKIGYSQIPQLSLFIVALIFMMAFQFTDNPLYAILMMLSAQIGVIFMTCYDEKEDERKANEEALAMLDEN